MKKIKSIVLLVLLTTNLSFAQSKKEKLQQLFEFYKQQNQFNGSVFVSQKGEVLLNKGYGLANVDLKKENNSNSIFQIYSITKTFTATVILKLVEEKKLSLQDKLSKFYPDYPDASSISIESLLNHTAGVYDYTRGNDMKDQTEKSFIEFQKTKPLDFLVGTDWSYSNSGYYFLGYVIQKVTGISYEKAVEKYILKPLLMEQSGFAFKNLKSQNKVIGYEVFSEKAQKPSVVYDPPGPFAAGGIYSSVEDLNKYYNGLKNYKIISKKTLEKAYTPFKNNYGYGWVTIPMFEKMTVGHSGAGAGFRSNFVQIPEDDICIILLTNTERDLNIATSAIIKILYNKDYKIPIVANINKETLKQYVGTYQVENNFVIYLTIVNNKLIAQSGNNPKSILYPVKENLFYAEELNGYVSFEKNSNAQIASLIFYKGDQPTKAKKIFPSWGIVGSATEKGWEGPDTKLFETETKGIWTIKNVSLKTGELKFRFNDDWTLNFGKDMSDRLMPEGNNLEIKVGVYDVLLDLTDFENPKYKIVKTYN
ncbi:serine hydrolase [Flavobacterium sp.]|uniref:serine hydrolase n=1 Tax=Flavobacterium sp. TaxID=239 RepID=UPI00286E1F14|nr:serine hydrolase [Flavobacterium sp.]